MKRTFEEFLKIWYNMSIEDFYSDKINDYQRKALKIQYKDNQI